MRKTTQEFIDGSLEIHGNKYDYSKVEYKNTHTKVCIICPEHGEFWQLPNNHIKGQGCPICKIENTKKRNTLTTEEFIEKARKIWGEKFDYSKINYIDAKTKVCIICPEHGEFWQTPTNHLSGYDCIECSKNGYTKETRIKNIIIETFQNEEIIYQAHLNWLGRQSFDLYMPKYKIAIEYQGQQHFTPIKLFGGKKTFEYVRKMDIKKNMLALKNNVTIFYFSFIKTDIGDFPYNVIFDINILIQQIKEIIKNYE